MENASPELSEVGPVEEKKPKKKRSPILQGQIDTWMFRRIQSYGAVADEFYAILLNAIYKGTDRGQNQARATLFVQEGWTPIARDRFIPKGIEAFYRTKEKVENLRRGYQLDPSVRKVTRKGRKVTVLEVKVVGLRGHDPKPIFKLYGQLKRSLKKRKAIVSFRVIPRR